MRIVLKIILSLLAISCNAQSVLNPYNYVNNTTTDGKQVVWVIGDSHTVRRNPTGSTYGPTPSAGTVFQWDVTNQNLYTVGATDILQSGAGADWGSVWPQAGISYVNATGNFPVFVTSGVGGSNYAPRTGDTGDWSAADVLYANAKSDLDNCLAYLGLATPKYIIVNCGINDTRGATSLATIQTEINAFYAKLKTDYPRATILIVQIGRNEAQEVSSDRVVAVRSYLRQVAIDNDNVYIAANEAPLWAAGYYDSDNLHLLQTGNNLIGEMLGRWFENHTYSEWARAIIACHFDALSTTRKDLIQTFITSLGATYFTHDFIYNYHTTIVNNGLFDWCFMWAGLNSGASFTANDCITTNGTSSYWRTGYNNSWAIHASLNNGFIGLKIKTNRDLADGATHVAMGAAATGTQIVIGQNNSNLAYYRINDNTTNTYATWPELPNDTYVATARNGTTKELLENGSVVASASVTSVSTVNGMIYIGALDNATVASLFIDIDVEYANAGQRSGISTFYNAMEALIDGW